jgi:hypothetical protein
MSVCIFNSNKDNSCANAQVGFQMVPFTLAVSFCAGDNCEACIWRHRELCIFEHRHAQNLDFVYDAQEDPSLLDGCGKNIKRPKAPYWKNNTVGSLPARAYAQA